MSHIYKFVAVANLWNSTSSFVLEFVILVLYHEQCLLLLRQMAGDFQFHAGHADAGKYDVLLKWQCAVAMANNQFGGTHHLLARSRYGMRDTEK